LINGWINIDKPVGMSSAAAVAKVKRLLAACHTHESGYLKIPAFAGMTKNKIKIGHAGTLDPLASGILPLALGEATKTVQYMMDAIKAYEFTVSWGQERSTDDAEGKIINSSECRPTIEQIQNILPQFIGDIAQTPPNYSAIKLEGKRAYNLARSGKDVKIEARQVFIQSLEISSPITNNQQLTTAFTCYCGKGTYIRSLARDMGRVLGCFGYISSLRRIKVGKFTEESAISLEMLENMVHKGETDFLQPVESSLDDILAWEVNSAAATDLRHGKTIVIPELLWREEGFIFLAKYNYKALAMCKLVAGAMKPLRVFNL
jgi:tRNA pseudouridine55 synthase